MQKRRGTIARYDEALPLTAVKVDHELVDSTRNIKLSRRNCLPQIFARHCHPILLVIIFLTLYILLSISGILVVIRSQFPLTIDNTLVDHKVDIILPNAVHFFPMTVAPLQYKDKEQYTIRINTYRRNNQLLLSLNHHSSCPGVALIQVVWCDNDHFPPPEITNHSSSKVMVEFHSINSLNERFHILSRDEAWLGWSTHPKNPYFNVSFRYLETPTLGILSIDDDVLRPCEAIDSGFFRWTDYPDRIVGYDARIHIQRFNESQVWSYGYLSQVRKENKYSITLTRYSFLHRDYLHAYMNNLPKTIFDFVEKHMNCEDIAMSFFVSSLTQGKLPLLADSWAMQSMEKLKSTKKISDSYDHKAVRDLCVDSFAEILGLKNRLIPQTIVDSKTRNWFGVGVDRDGPIFGSKDDWSQRRQQHHALVSSWELKKIMRDKLWELKRKTAREAEFNGLLDV